MGLQGATTKLYGNCAGYSQSGELIFRCNTKKMRWYLNRGLAEEISSDPPAIRLLFKPKGNGHAGDRFFLQARKNECVVCGTDKDLTRHHVLPHSYRRWFPKSLDCYGPYDVFALCIDHHEQYEESADTLKEKLVAEFNAPLHGIGGSACPVIRKGASAAHALLKYGSKIPEHKVAELEGVVKKTFGGELSSDALKKLVDSSRSAYKTHGRLVVEELNGFEGIGKFVIRWRKHFLETMEPKYLPKWWKVDRVFTPEA